MAKGYSKDLRARAVAMVRGGREPVGGAAYDPRGRSKQAGQIEKA
jgi:hypothetical protein